ncbi:MAG TPA: hypothetical protein VHH52_06860 [Pseudonocardiaceae bacterium]|nr:hypothetical protein [Pseudonocardiaceae bacterium]
MRYPELPRRQRVRAITLTVETLSDGRLRVSTPQARGWATTAQDPMGLARAVELAYREVAVASYARARGTTYDLDQLTERVPGDPLADAAMQRAPRRVRKKVHDPGAWAKFDDGRWRSPSGRLYRPDSTAVRNVIARRVALGLPV